MNFLDGLEKLVEQAVGGAFDQEERLRQKRQAKMVSRDSLHVTKQKKEENVEEAEDEDAEEPDKEDASKLSGDPKKVTKKLAKRSAKKERENPVPGTSTSKKLTNPSAEELKKPDFQAIAKNINLLRGGKSIKNKEVRKNLKAYIDELDSQERKEVLIYLNSLAQVLAGTKSAGELTDSPHDVGAVTKTPKKKPKVQISQSKKSNSDGAIVVGAS